MSDKKAVPQGDTARALEGALKRVTGVQSVRVVGEDAPREIHIVAVGRKPSRQFVRDVEALAMAELGLDIDHRIVSIVQIEDPEDRPRLGEAGRPSIERVSIGTRSNSEWVEVTLKWPQGNRTSGTGAAGPSREARARGAAAAVVECLDPTLSERKATLEIDHVTLHAMSSSAEWVLVHTTVYDEAGSTPLLGSARIVDDIATASVRAMLNAVSRKLLRI